MLGIPKKLLLLIMISCIRADTQNTKKIQGRIISGTVAAAGQFPWQVILKRDEWDDLLCGGSIISRSWVLTAAHCAYGRDSIFLVFGTNELNDEQALNMTSTQLYVHPNYNDKMNNDIALIKLPQQLVFSDKVQAIELVSSAQESTSFVGTVGTIAGFGLMDDEYLDYSPNLLYAQVQIIDNVKCLGIYGKDVVLDSTICADGLASSNMSPCSGDSGGPLIIYGTDSGSYVQIGINSFVAEDQCTSGYPSGYVRLTSFLNYIADITGLPVN
ncbi:brachyurin [Scaptodrosophila lebanonensis]|uniref:Brachyurin n=1 Tax=Drosophila lebanonensis TaxID=7225 RepID=A0A6J2TYY6_DROLE|nr:brachyurin [Scaptodrosophila lebanonensis]